MQINGQTRTLLATATFAVTLVFASCAPTVTKGSVYQGVSKGVRVGAHMSEVAQYVDSLEVNGVRPTRYEYVRNISTYPVVAPDGQEAEVEGTIYASFSSGIGEFFCPHVGVIFYFDKSGKLITYHIDCFG